MNTPLKQMRKLNGDEVRFAAKLTPYRSLSPAAFRLLMSVTAAVCALAGGFFFYLGAWPIAGFLGLDILLIYWAFKSNFRACEQYETVAVTASRLVVRRMRGARMIEELEFPHCWVRLELERNDELEMIGPLKIWFKGRCHEIGRFLNPADREDFARALETAIYTR